MVPIYLEEQWPMKGGQGRVVTMYPPYPLRKVPSRFKVRRYLSGWSLSTISPYSPLVEPSKKHTMREWIQWGIYPALLTGQPMGCLLYVLAMILPLGEYFTMQVQWLQIRCHERLQRGIFHYNAKYYPYSLSVISTIDEGIIEATIKKKYEQSIVQGGQSS